MKLLTALQLQTPPGESLLNITEQVQAAVKESGVAEGICVVFVPHTTAGLIVNSGVDPATAADIGSELRRLVPTRVDFQHTYDTPADAAGHIKVTLVGSSLSLIVSRGELILGGSQSLMLAEFDGPRERKVLVRVLADPESGRSRGDQNP
jgi:secondary thiamine-phosphate synthase enzyme